MTYIRWDEHCCFSFLEGKVLTDVSVNKDTDLNDHIVFTLDNGDKYILVHEQDCCESVTIEDICGDMADLTGLVIFAEEVSGETRGKHEDGTYTWTFYRIGTAKGDVTIRWYGTSNGYYSESVSFGKMEIEDGY